MHVHASMRPAHVTLKALSALIWHRRNGNIDLRDSLPLRFDTPILPMHPKLE